MSARIAFLTPNAALGERVLHIAEELGMAHSVAVYEGHLQVVLETARELEAQGTEVFVARGTSAEALLRSTIRTPIVEVPVTGQDLAKVLRDAKILTGLERPRIALLAFASIHRDLEVFAGLLGISLDVYDVTSDAGVMEAQVLRAKADGADIIVAGSVSSSIARNHGMLSMQLDSGDISLRIALQEARKVAYARKLEKAQAQRVQAVMESSRDGILVLDEHGRILTSNHAAQRVLQLSSPPVDAFLADLLPNAELHTCLRDGQPIFDVLLPYGDSALLFSASPTKVDGRAAGAVVVLQPSGVITALESKIRKSLLGKGFSSQYSFPDILGVSPQMRKTLELARRMAVTSGTILITGETGSGKELLAQAIHSESPYNQNSFVAVNCAALPPTLLESELFGYEDGAFTGARRKGKPGMFELAHGGTIFLDEIAEMDHYGQTRLLRVLQEKCVMRLGSDRYIPVDARVVAATNRNLREEVRAGRFREDLYYRLHLFRLAIPPLREREGDVPYLAHCFATAFKKKYGRQLRFSSAAMALLQQHDWPGNVRELSAVVERLALSAASDSPSLAEVEQAMDLGPAPSRKNRDAAPRYDEKSEERQYIIDALEQSGGSMNKAAELLGMHRSTLHRKLRALGLRKGVS
ncbi:PAS sensor protein [uncultured delta proteobacterium]|uniref:PAS sensor protein n=1 Tax=uncultured delta proteobacterium TaxID=34034 RepID=A0A212JFK1_9DELT|nr:PAS sensor protein [uncultured delta proteobacterium]